jgi:hypothetical protein
MRIVEDAFTYRLVWALEAIRTRRMSLGWSPETIAGGAAATLETGVPQFMMAIFFFETRLAMFPKSTCAGCNLRKSHSRYRDRTTNETTRY